jgi:ergothioneine biosynthesis protein EgtB
LESSRATSRDALLARFERVRSRTEELAAPLSAEDQGLQSMPSASPTKWHRAHTTWFFETFVLAPRGVAPVDARYAFLFNSYYEAAGPRHVRARRGMLSRPSCGEIARYRAAVDARVVEMVAAMDDAAFAEAAPIVELGVAHEEQHQEVLLTDILHALAENPTLPAYRAGARSETRSEAHGDELRFVAFEGGVVSLGDAGAAFAFDNERPRHKRWLDPFAIADRLVTVSELKAFIRDGGYTTPTLWLSDGWDAVKSESLHAPLYARIDGESLVVFGLDGEREARDDEPVTHVSFYEADAIARWLGARLPTEAEWEIAASRARAEGNFVESGALRALPARGAGVRQLFGDAWEWTRSGYEPYPGYAPARGALGEYNGKFMVSQIVLRGGSCFTPAGHVRASYRNFWPPSTRFQVTGIRLAKDA